MSSSTNREVPAGNSAGAKRDRLSRLLFHLEKALAKSLPVVGPFFEELVYEQFRHELLPSVNELESGQLDQLLETLSAYDLEDMERKLVGATDELRTVALTRMAQLLSDLSDLRTDLQSDVSEVSSRLDELEEGVAQIPNLGVCAAERRHAVC